MKTSTSSRTGVNSQLIRLAVPLTIAALTVLVYWPGLFADWGRDDYMQLAMARMVGSPWPFFITDHFPLPQSVFRPLGFASFWLGQAISGTHYTGHAIQSALLLALIALTLFSLLRALDVGRPAAFLATLLFTLHPVTQGTALWWSARFDLLATLFALLAIRLALASCQRTSIWALAGCLISLLAAMLSKEIGLIAVLPVLLIWQHWAWSNQARFRTAQLASLLAVLTAVGFLAWRAAVLGTGGSGITDNNGLLTAIVEGMTRWVQLAPGYFLYWERMDHAARWGLLIGLPLLALAGAFVFRVRHEHSERFLWLALGCGLLLLALPALVQAPVVRLNAAALDNGVSSVESAMQSRLYFLSLIGFSLIAATVFDRVLVSRSRLACALTLAGGGLVLLAFASISHQQAREFADVSRNNARLAHAAVTVVQQLDLRASPCHVMFKNIEPPPEWSRYVSMDSIIKALHPVPEQIDHCFFHANYPTFYHFAASDYTTMDSLPFTPVLIDDKPLASRQIGQLTMVHLAGPDSLSEAQRSGLRTVELPPLN
jgi:hypothetical protein